MTSFSSFSEICLFLPSILSVTEAKRTKVWWKSGDICLFRLRSTLPFDLLPSYILFMHSSLAFVFLACLISFFVNLFAMRLGRPKNKQSVLHSVARPFILLIDSWICTFLVMLSTGFAIILLTKNFFSVAYKFPHSGPNCNGDTFFPSFFMDPEIENQQISRVCDLWLTLVFDTFLCGTLSCSFSCKPFKGVRH